MKTLRTMRVAAAVAAISTGVLAGGFSGVASAKAVPKLTVTPATGLSNGKTVIVKGTGFKPKDQVYITECLRTATGQAGCNIATAVPQFITAAGVLPATKFKLVTGVIGTGKCGTAASNLAKCAVSVGNISGKDTASANIVFKAPKK